MVEHENKKTVRQIENRSGRNPKNTYLANSQTYGVTFFVPKRINDMVQIAIIVGYFCHNHLLVVPRLPEKNAIIIAVQVFRYGAYVFIVNKASKID